MTNLAKDPNFIFVGGSPRSGTTLTEQILTSHPQVAGAGELAEMDRIKQELRVQSKRMLQRSCAAHPKGKSC